MPIAQRITLLPAAPDPASDTPQDFSQKAAASVLAQRGLPVELNAFAAQANETAAAVNAQAAAAEIAAQNADAAKLAAIAAAGAQPWVSGTTYGKNVPVISQVNFQPYRRQVAGAGTVDPANDTAGQWMPLFGNGSFTPRAAASATFDLSTTNFFTRAMSASETWVFANCPTNGFSFAVELTYTGGTLTLPTTVKTGNNVVYSFTPGKTYILLFVTTNKGATRWRMVVTQPYDN
jgi:hypothetical protein